MVFMDECLDKIQELEESRSFEDAMSYIKYLAILLIDSNRVGRSLDRAIAKSTTKRKTKKIFAKAIVELLLGDEYTEKEEEFIDILKGLEDLD